MPLHLVTVFFVVCHGSFKDVHQVSIAFGFHFVVGNEPKGCAVNAVPDTVGGFRVIFKDMAQMGIACPASYLNALHPVAVVLDLHDGRFLDGLREGRPAATALVLISGGEQRFSCDNVHIDALGEMIPEFILIGIFRPAFCQRREKNNVKRREEIDANAGIENAGIPTAGCMLPVNDPPEPLPAVR